MHKKSVEGRPLNMKVPLLLCLLIGAAAAVNSTKDVEITKVDHPLIEEMGEAGLEAGEANLRFAISFENLRNRKVHKVIDEVKVHIVLFVKDNATQALFLNLLLKSEWEVRKNDRKVEDLCSLSSQCANRDERFAGVAMAIGAIGAVTSLFTLGEVHQLASQTHHLTVDVAHLWAQEKKLEKLTESSADHLRNLRKEEDALLLVEYLNIVVRLDTELIREVDAITQAALAGQMPVPLIHQNQTKAAVEELKTRARSKGLEPTLTHWTEATRQRVSYVPTPTAMWTIVHVPLVDPQRRMKAYRLLLYRRRMGDVCIKVSDKAKVTLTSRNGDTANIEEPSACRRWAHGLVCPPAVTSRGPSCIEQLRKNGVLQLCKVTAQGHGVQGMDGVCAKPSSVVRTRGLGSQGQVPRG